MPDEKKRNWLLCWQKPTLPLIEDDVYAELYFGSKTSTATRPLIGQGSFYTVDPAILLTSRSAASRGRWRWRRA